MKHEKPIVLALALALVALTVAAVFASRVQPGVVTQYIQSPPKSAPVTSVEAR